MCGRIRADRGRFPVEFKAKKTKKRVNRFLSDNARSVYWKDNRDVFVLFSMSDTSNVEVCSNGREFRCVDVRS